MEGVGNYVMDESEVFCSIYIEATEMDSVDGGAGFATWS